VLFIHLTALILLVVLLLGCSAAPSAGPVPSGGPGPDSASPTLVRVEKVDGRFRLMRNGQPYFIRGVGGSQRLEELVALGGNSIRTWSVDQAEPVLDRAHKLGVSVTVGLWFKHPRHGYSYDDAAFARKEIDTHVAEVRRLKHHPAILMWAVGNEVELGAQGDQSNMWRTLNQAAKEIKQVDPSRPTILIVAEIFDGKLEQILKHCPDIDILGINSYGAMDTSTSRAREQGWDRPIAITEFGPRGWWEVAKAPWGAPIEPNSTDKADTYFSRYFAAVNDHPLVIGSFAFLWGQKQECTHTWFGMFLPGPNGSRLGAADAMSFAWTGRWPANRCPRIWDPRIDGPTDDLAPGAPMKASIAAADPDGDTLAFEWEVLEESRDRKSGGDPESKPPVVPTEFATPAPGRAEFKAPSAPGAYRLFIYVRDGNNNAATANIPFRVK
jgi:hypothetical protein